MNHFILICLVVNRSKIFLFFLIPFDKYKLSKLSIYCSRIPLQKWGLTANRFFKVLDLNPLIPVFLRIQLIRTLSSGYKQLEMGIVFVNERNYLRTNEIFHERWSFRKKRWANDLDRSDKWTNDRKKTWKNDSLLLKKTNVHWKKRTQ